LTLALDGGGGEWSEARPGCAIALGKGPPGTYWIWGWVNLRLEEKSFASAEDRTPVARSSRP
jgi:hypothetical protein